MNIQQIISDRVTDAFLSVGAPHGCDVQVRLAAKPQFGDYQANGIMAIAKKMGSAPRQLAEAVLQQLDLNDIASKVEIAGPGFINIFLNPNWIANNADIMLNDNKLAITTATPQTIVVDYSAPNVAKEMHVGNIRSTIIGDAVVKTLERIGHHVIRANHIGDWGTQFGMLIAYLERKQNEHATDMDLADLEAFYREAKQHYDSDIEFAERARGYVVKLQSGDSYCLSMWRKLIDITMQQNQLTYQRLNVSLNSKDTMGESLYNSMLPEIVADLTQQGLAHKSDGATVVFLDEYKNKEGEPMGVIIQKKDGGYLYATTDIACVKYRYETLHADRILYYTDSRQHQHLSQVWLIVRKAKYIPDTVSLEHHMFGMMLGKDGKPFKTRSGGTVKLTELLNEAVERTHSIVEQRDNNFSADEKEQLINALAIGAVKYADLSKHRTTDYIFDWDSMLSLEGNTAPYMQYAYARVASVFRKVGLNMTELTGEMKLSSEHESKLATRLLQFEETLYTVARDGTPHLLCGYLYDIAGLFSSFYQNCPILSTEETQLRNSRLRLAALTARVLKEGLNTLGIETVERM